MKGMNLKFMFLLMFVGIIEAYLFGGLKSEHTMPDVEKPNIPISDPGTEIPILFGTREQKTLLTYWYGDLELEPFYSEVSKK